MGILSLACDCGRGCVAKNVPLCHRIAHAIEW